MGRRGLSAEETKFFKETFEKEDRQRLQWFIKNGGHRLLESTRTTEATTSEKTCKEPKKRVDVFEPPKLEVPSKDEEPVVLDTMRPVPEHIKKLLYTGVCALGEGRCQYLTERYKTSPPKKFYFPETTSWQYGWRVDSMDPIYTENRCGRRNVIHESFYRRAGVGRDPDHYKEAVNAKAPISLPLL